jgi:putative FmdB family regulatory protein
MPIYEYQCQSCQQELEVLQKISDAPLEICPECGKAALRKKISAAAFRLSGGGWYETDFKTGDKKNLAGDDKSDKSGKADKPGSGGDKAASGGAADAGAGSSAKKTDNSPAAG